MALSEKQKSKIKNNRCNAFALDVKKSDSSNLDIADARLFVGTKGNIKVDTIDGQTVTLKNIASGTFIDWIRVKKVHSTGTTASDIVAIY